jgi:putative transposase
VLGIWFQPGEGAKFWLRVLSELKQRGLEDVLVCCVDGLGGLSEAIEAVYPEAWVQTCLVHQVRQSLRFVPYRDRRWLARAVVRFRALRAIAGMRRVVLERRRTR